MLGSLALLAQEFDEFEEIDAAGGAVMSIVYLAVLVLVIAGMWRVFTKAGQPGWAALIPIYNLIVLLRVAGRPWWWVLLSLIPIVNIVVAIIIAIDVSRNFGKGVGFALGLVFLPFIFYPILGFGSAQYRGMGAAE